MSAVLDWRGCRLYIGGYAGVSCRSMLEVTPENRQLALDIYRESTVLGNFEIEGLLVAGSGFESYAWLHEFPYLRNLYIDGRGRKLKLLPEIQYLSNLRNLGLSDVSACELDFSCFPHLETYSGIWLSSFKNLGKRVSLNTLHLEGYSPKAGNIDELGELYKLRQLTLTNPKITSLSGIGGLEDLYRLGIFFSKTLETLTELDRLESLRVLEIEACKKITNLELVTKIPKLRVLRLADLGEVQAIDFILSMHDLEFFSFVGTKINSNDLSPLVNHPRLTYAGFLDSKSYSHSSEEIRRILSMKVRATDV